MVCFVCFFFYTFSFSVCIDFFFLISQFFFFFLDFHLSLDDSLLNFPPGHLLAVACGDGSIRLISSYSGKTVHHYPAGQQEGDASSQEGKPPAKITCLGWGVNFTDSKAAQRHLQSAGGQLSVEDLLSPDMQPSKAAAYMKADLPRELALLDIESSLPKLSTLPGTGSE